MKAKTINLFGLILAPVISGALLVMAFPMYELGGLAWVSLVPLLVAIAGKSIRYGFLLSYVCGMIFFSEVFRWIFDAPAYTLAHHAILVPYLGLYFAFFGLFVNLVSQRWGLTYGYFAAPFAWVFFEYLRSNLGFLSLPIPLLAHSQYQHLRIIQFTSITGAYGLSFLIVLVNSCLSLAVLRFFSGTKIDKQFDYGPPSKNGTIFIISVTASLVFLALLYGKIHLSMPLAGKKIKISVVQGNIDRRMKSNPKKYAKSIMQKYEDLTNKVSRNGAKLIVWPEGATPGFVLKNLTLHKQTVSLIKQIGAYFLIGSSEYPKFSKEQNPGLGDVGNTALFFSPNGKVLGQYLKIRLIPFGEYVPHEGVIPWPQFIVPEDTSSFEIPGKEHIILEMDGIKFGTVICWETHFPRLFRKFVKNGANFMLNITNEGWFGEAGLYQKMVTSVFRAVENRVSIARAANTGISCFIDPHGRITGRVRNNGKEVFVDGYLTREITLSHKRTFYTIYGDVFAYISVIITGLFLVLSIFRPKKRL